MKLIRLAEFLAIKYADSSSLEASLRSKIASLWQVPNKTHNVLRACADANPANPKNSYEQKAIVGFQFCRKLLSMIDYLQANNDKLSLGEIREILLSIVKLIADNKNIKFDTDGKPTKEGDEPTVQFPHVSELIFQIIPAGSKKARELRDDQFNKAKIGLSRILSIAMDMSKDIQKLEMMSPEKFTYKGEVDLDMDMPKRFSPQRAALSESDIINFIRHYGDRYGISSRDDWELAFRYDQQLKEEITTVINALNRGHNPGSAAYLKEKITNILQHHKEKLQTNKEVFEPSEIWKHDEDDDVEEANTPKNASWLNEITLKYGDLP